ncbi:MAG: hypothetical protein RLZZ352_731 [Pseudomonadota bacterium]|jgi:predicted ATPase
MRIYIKGFKSIADGQYVGLGKKLTFLVGPNSAGKSVMLHALQKLSGTSPVFEPEDHLIHHNIFGDKVATSQAVGIEWESNGETLEYRATMFNSDHFLPTEENIEDAISDRFIPLPNEEGDNLILEGLHLSRTINHEPILTEIKQNIQFDNSLEENTPNQVWAKLTNYDLLYKWDRTGINYKEQPEKVKKQILNIFDWINECTQLFYTTYLEKYRDSNKSHLVEQEYTSTLKQAEECKAMEIIVWDRSNLISYIRFLEGKTRQYHLNQFYRYNTIIKKIVDKINEKFTSEYPGKNFKVAVVSANRTTPIETDLNVQLKPKQSIKNPYHDLIKSFIAKEWCHSATSKTKYNPLKSNNFGITHTIPQDVAKLARDVNHHLSEGLFIDNGYQVNITSTIKLSKPDTNEETLIEKINNNQFYAEHIFEYFEFEASMYVTDNFGRKLDFNRIGSGIGYVFPVLIECFKLENANGVVFIQQPELHLHPALQASLCDILIESAKDRMVIAETHSEYLILRALRRIRQTFNGTLLNEDLKLYPEDVAINYFEPMGDGTTKVHYIRIAPDGEFIDRWPKGFFPERDQELFDE